MKLWVIAGIALLASGPALASDQFDLICRAKGSEVRYRVDLAAGVWCGGACTIVNKIAAATPGMLTLVDRRAAYRGDWEASNTINRTTGAWNNYSFTPGTGSLPFQQEGTCEPAPFSGMPTPKF